MRSGCLAPLPNSRVRHRLRRSQTRAVPGTCLAAVSRHAEHVLRVADALLELPAVGRRLARLDALELRLRLVELPLRARVVDLVGLDGVVDERARTIREPPAEPPP